MKQQIILNVDFESLEKILKMDDPEVKLQVTEGILSRFADRYIKGIGESKVITQAKWDVEKIYKKALQEFVGSPQQFSTKWEYTPEFKTAVRREVEAEINRQLSNVMTLRYGSNIDSQVKEALDRRGEDISHLIDRLVEDRITREVTRKVKEKLDAVLGPEPQD